MVYIQKLENVDEYKESNFKSPVNPHYPFQNWGTTVYINLYPVFFI